MKQEIPEVTPETCCFSDKRFTKIANYDILKAIKGHLFFKDIRILVHRKER